MIVKEYLGFKMLYFKPTYPILSITDIIWGYHHSDHIDRYFEERKILLFMSLIHRVGWVQTLGRKSLNLMSLIGGVGFVKTLIVTLQCHSFYSCFWKASLRVYQGLYGKILSGFIWINPPGKSQKNPPEGGFF